MFQPQFSPTRNPMQPAAHWRYFLRSAFVLVGLCLLNACIHQSPLVALGLESGIRADSHTRLRFPAHTPVLIRFDSTQAPEAWAVAAHQGVAMHFPKAQRQQTLGHGLEWFVRWPYVEPRAQKEPMQVKPEVEVPVATIHLSAAAEPVERHSVKTDAWYSLAGAKNRLTGAKRRFGKLAERLPSPLFWRRDESQIEASEPLPAPVRGLAQVVVSDRNNGKVLALADVEIDQSVLLRLANKSRGKLDASQRHANNERQIAKAFAALAASLVASGDS